MKLESVGKMIWIANNEKIKKYEILIEIVNSKEWFRINMDDKSNILLFLGSEKGWRPQNPNELEKNKNQLGKVIVKKENKLKKEYHEFDLFCDEIDGC